MKNKSRSAAFIRWEREYIKSVTKSAKQELAELDKLGGEIMRKYFNSKDKQEKERLRSQSRRKAEREKVLKELEPILKEMREKELAKLKALNELGVSEYSSIKPDEKIEYTPPWETWEKKK
jgi:hypothetical protein